MHHAHGHVEGAWTKLDHRDQFALGFRCHPQPHLFAFVIKFGPQFIQLVGRLLTLNGNLIKS
jgi:hypothetical protein